MRGARRGTVTNPKPYTLNPITLNPITPNPKKELLKGLWVRLRLQSLEAWQRLFFRGPPRFRVEGLWFKVYIGFRVYTVGFRVEGLCRVQGIGFRV